MANKYHGISVNFGLGPTITSVVGSFQTNDHGLEMDNEVIRSGDGTSVEKTFYDYKETATFEYVATAVGGPSGTGTVTTPGVGDLVSVSDSQYPAINHTNWLVDTVDIKRSNTAAVRVTLKMTQYPSITA